MLIEIHMIQNHSPSNLNRDDLGAPKTCIFGGVTRARISSQCIKRSIRRNVEFHKAVEKDGGVRTRRLITILAEAAHGSSPAPTHLIELVTKAFEKGGVKKDATKDDPNATNILMFVSESTIIEMANAVNKATREKSKPDQLTETLAGCLAEGAVAPDMALCGRMTELDSDGLFRKVNFHIEAALAAAHGISTHEVTNEVDYFTAVDDRASGTGAGHVNEAMFASACFYKHFCIDWNQLLTNLALDLDVAKTTLRQFLMAAALSTPSGKQNSFAAYNLPDGILVEIKTDRCLPISYANAFADPVPLKSPRGLIGESIARLGQHVHEIEHGYGIAANRFWFSPGARHRLAWIDQTEKNESAKEKPIIDDPKSNVDALDNLVSVVMNELDAQTAGATS